MFICETRGKITRPFTFSSPSNPGGVSWIRPISCVFFYLEAFQELGCMSGPLTLWNHICALGAGRGKVSSGTHPHLAQCQYVLYTLTPLPFSLKSPDTIHKRIFWIKTASVKSKNYLFCISHKTTNIIPRLNPTINYWNHGKIEWLYTSIHFIQV